MKSNLASLAAIFLIAVAVTARAQEHQSPQAKPAVATTAPAKTSTVRLGDKVISIPDPEGFEEGTAQFESFKQRLVTTEDPGADVLLAHLPVADCELMRKGLAPSYETYTKISVMKLVREMPITRAEMEPIIVGFRANIGAILDPNGPTVKEIEKHLDRGVSELDQKATKFDFAKPQQLGEFDIRPDANGFLLLLTMKVNTEGTERVIPMLATLTFLRVKDRIIFVTGYKKYRSQADIDAIKKFATKWTTSILAANQQP